jgi:hypothetical protein
MRILPALIGVLFAGIGAARADVIGQASVVDGDTIEIHGERVRLYGMDAPERRQICTIAGESRTVVGSEPRWRSPFDGKRMIYGAFETIVEH